VTLGFADLLYVGFAAVVILGVYYSGRALGYVAGYDAAMREQRYKTVI